MIPSNQQLHDWDAARDGLRLCARWTVAHEADSPLMRLFLPSRGRAKAFPSFQPIKLHVHSPSSRRFISLFTRIIFHPAR